MNVHAHVCVSEKDLLNHFKPMRVCTRAREEREKRRRLDGLHFSSCESRVFVAVCTSQTANISASLHSPPAVSPI